MSKRVALVTGIGGQDGSYLTELLLAKGYTVHGVIRRSSLPNTQRLDHVIHPDSRGTLHYGDLEEGLAELLYDVRPDEIYNLAAMSHVAISFPVPTYTAEVVGRSVERLLRDIRVGIKFGMLSKDVRYYQASSSEMFGMTPPPQNEETPMRPVSPYGRAKLMAYHATRGYRFAYQMFCSNGILFNHESERRGVNFVTRKITRAAARIKLGLQKELVLGNLDAKRDWGHARDYVECMWMILQHDRPDDFVVATGQQHTVREFAEKTFAYLGLDFYQHLVQDESYRRPAEVESLLGDATKFRTTFNWTPKITFDELVRVMIEHDLKMEAQA